MEQTEIRPGVFLTHHDWAVCGGEPCPIHFQTDHEYRQYPQEWRKDWGVMIRQTPDGDVVDPDEYLLRQEGGYLLQNSARCHGCGNEVISTHRHDFVTCSCGNVSVDGGHSYERRVFGDKGYENTSIWVGRDNE